MSTKKELPSPTQELLKVIGTPAQLKKKLSPLSPKQLEKISKTFASVGEEILLERQIEAEEEDRINKLLLEALNNVSKEHEIPMDVLKERTSKL